MDGSSFVPRLPGPDQDTTAADRAAMHQALCMMTFMAFLTIGAVLVWAQFFPTTYAQTQAWLSDANI